MKENYACEPAAVEVHSHGTVTDVILRRNIAKVTRSELMHADPSDTVQMEQSGWECDEHQFRYRGTLTAKEVSADFEKWWSYEKPHCYQATEAERLTVLEAAVMDLAAMMASSEGV